MFLAFFHVVLCVTLSSPLFLLLLFLASCQVQCEQLHCLESHATLNATQTANAPRGRERVSEWLAEHEALGQQLRQLAVPCYLCRFPFASPPLRCSQSQNQDSQYQAKLSACTQHFPLHCCALANTQCIRWRQAGPGLLWAWPLREFSKLFECYLGLYLCESKRCCNNNFHCKPSTQVQKLTEKSKLIN